MPSKSKVAYNVLRQTSGSATVRGPKALVALPRGEEKGAGRVRSQGTRSMVGENAGAHAVRVIQRRHEV